MTEEFSDKRVEIVTRRLQEELVDEAGHPAVPSEVETVVAAKAQRLADAPVQEFVPLLVEHQARDELRGHGLHRDLGEETTDKDGRRAGQESVDVREHQQLRW
jgi:hypothetical protein